MGTIIAVANQKGGVGKTTTAVNLSASIAITEKRTLLVDMDPQCNASSGVGVSYNKVSSNIYDVLIGKKSMKEIVLETQVPYLDLAPSHPDLIGVEVELLEHLFDGFGTHVHFERVAEFLSGGLTRPR